MNSACNVALRNVGDFVSQYAREFVFVACRFEQARMNADEPARQGKCIDALIVDDKEDRRAVDAKLQSG